MLNKVEKIDAKLAEVVSKLEHHIDTAPLGLTVLRATRLDTLNECRIELGGIKSLQGGKGDKVVLDFFQTWLKYCIEKLGDINELGEVNKYKLVSYKDVLNLVKEVTTMNLCKELERRLKCRITVLEYNKKMEEKRGVTNKESEYAIYMHCYYKVLDKLRLYTLIADNPGHKEYVLLTKFVDQCMEKTENTVIDSAEGRQYLNHMKAAYQEIEALMVEVAEDK